MKARLATVLMVLCSAIAHEGRSQHTCVSSDLTPTVISGDEVRRSGIIRLAGLYRLMPDWHTTSTDFYLWDFAPGIHALPQWGGVQIMIDGQPVSTTLLGESHLNAHPLDVGLIDSVLVFEGSVICDGVYAPSGMLSIHTRLERGYLSAGGAIAMANESGDPGPYLFTELESPNIDRSGPVGMWFGAVSGENWHLRGQEIIDEHHVTDVRLLPRVRRIYKNQLPPRDFLDGRRADAKLATDRAAFSVSIDESRFDHFRFVPGVGSEVPMSADWARVGVHGGGRISDRIGVFFAGESSIRKLNPHPDSLDLVIHWRERSTVLHGGITLHSPYGKVGTGFSGTATRVDARQTLLNPEIRGTAWFLLYEGAPTTEVRTSAMLRSAREADRTIRSIAARIAWSPFAGHSLLAGASSDQLPGYTVAPAFYWTQRGLEAPAIPGLFEAGDVNRNHAVRRTASVGWNWRFRHYVDASLTGQLAEFKNFPLATYDRTFVRDIDEFINQLQWFDTQTIFLPTNSGRLTRVAFEASARPIGALQLRFYHARTAILDEETAFETAWSIVPRRRTFASITFAPRDRVSLHARISHESESFWPDFHRVATATDNLYPSVLPPLTLLDIAFTKRFWSHRLQASVLLSNVLDRPFQRHPAGATESVSLLARIQAEI